MNCPITSLISNAITPPSISESTFTSYSNSVVGVPMASLSKYKSHSIWSKFSKLGINPDFSYNSIYYVILDNNSVAVTYKNANYNSYSGSISIPSTVSYNGKTYNVISIGDYAFYNCESLTKLSIPNTITSIGVYAVSGCANLTSVNLPNSITNISKYAFARSGLTSVSIPNTISTINECVFASCTNLTSVNFGNSVTTIGYHAFYNCSSLTSVTIPASVTQIINGAFWACSNLKTLFSTPLWHRLYTSISELSYTDNKFW